MTLTKEQKRALKALKDGKALVPPSTPNGTWTVHADGGHVHLTKAAVKAVLRALPQAARKQVVNEVLTFLRMTETIEKRLGHV